MRNQAAQGFGSLRCFRTVRRSMENSDCCTAHCSPEKAGQMRKCSAGEKAGQMRKCSAGEKVRRGLQERVKLFIMGV